MLGGVEGREEQRHRLEPLELGRQRRGEAVPEAREVLPGSDALSMMRTLTPMSVSHRASTSPVGPAPTMRTWSLGMAARIAQDPRAC